MNRIKLQRPAEPSHELEKAVVGFFAGSIFSGRVRSDEADEQLRTELYGQIGKLKVELDWLQKKSGLSR